MQNWLNQTTKRDAIWKTRFVLAQAKESCIRWVQILHGNEHFAVLAHCNVSAADGECSCSAHAADKCTGRGNGWQEQTPSIYIQRRQCMVESIRRQHIQDVWKKHNKAHCKTYVLNFHFKKPRLVCFHSEIPVLLGTADGRTDALLPLWLNKNSSGDEIANVNFLRRYGTYVLQNTKKENLLRLTNQTIASLVLRIQSWIYKYATVHLAVIEYLCRGSRAVPLQTFTSRQ